MIEATTADAGGSALGALAGDKPSLAGESASGRRNKRASKPVESFTKYVQVSAVRGARGVVRMFGARQNSPGHDRMTARNEGRNERSKGETPGRRSTPAAPPPWRGHREPGCRRRAGW